MCLAHCGRPWGKRRYVKSLQTHDANVARARKHAALADFMAAIEAARNRTSADPMVDAGIEWRTTLSKIEAADVPTLRQWADAPTGSLAESVESARERAREVLEDEAEAMADKLGNARALVFYDIATGKLTPLLHHVESWLAEGGARGPIAERTKAQYRADVGGLEAWARGAGVQSTVQAFTKAVAGRFVTDNLVGPSVHRKTANRKISAASAYWRWLVKRGLAETNPWSGQSLPKASRVEGPATSKRPFTDSEVALLLDGNTDAELRDAMTVAALSGMRIEEIYRLQLEDCVDGWFDLRRAKTAAGVRRVPIHTELREIVTRRAKAKSASGFLFDEAGGAPKPGRERSMAASKRFGHYRQRLGVHDRDGGQRQSRVDFHSFRRWFVTKAREGFDRAVVAAIVGHEVGNLTDDVYSGGPSTATRRACVESVRLPATGPASQ